MRCSSSRWHHPGNADRRLGPHRSGVGQLRRPDGDRVTVIDSRGAFATPERFPTARILVGWPESVIGQVDLDRRTWVVILSRPRP